VSAYLLASSAILSNLSYISFFSDYSLVKLVLSY
jgi:hypothetical protein